MRVKPAAALLAIGSLIVVASPPAQAAVKKPAAPTDFNGDGKADVAVGHQFAKVSGQSAGAVTITYGGTGKHQVITLDSPGVPGKAARNSGFGSSIGSADFDRDGYADLAVGSEGKPTVVIVYGSRKGLSKRVAAVRSTQGSFRMLVADFNRNGKPDLVLTWLFGYGVAYDVGTGRGAKVVSMTSSAPEAGQSEVGAYSLPGDLDGDGYTDLLTRYQVDYDDGSTPPVYLELRKGSKNGLTEPAYSVAGGNWGSPGDFNGDGLTDLVTAVPAGVQIGYRTATGFAPPVLLTKTALGIPAALANNYPSSISVADINRDGISDVAMGFPRDTVGRASEAGSVIALLGGKKGLTGKGRLILTENTAGVPGTAQTMDSFGETITLADMYGDRRPELVVRARGGRGNVGTVYVFRNVKGRLVAKKPKVFTAKSFGFARDGMDFPILP